MKRTTLQFAILAALICSALFIFQAGPSEELVQVRHVIDGDTFITESGKTVRLIGVDTPELDGPRSERAEEAKKWMERFEGKEVKLVYDDKLLGPYERWLAYVYHRGEFLNRKLIEEGMAEVTLYDNRAKASELKGAR